MSIACGDSRKCVTPADCKSPSSLKQRRVAVRHRLRAVDRQQGLAVELVGGQAVRIEFADELAGVLVSP